MKQDQEQKRRWRGVVGPLRSKGPKPKPLPPDLAAASGTGSFSNFIYRCGPIVNTPQVHALFVGDWTSAANQTRATRLGQFITDLLNGPYMNLLAQYGCGTSGTLASSVFVAKPDNDLSGAELRTIVQNAINAGSVPEPTPNRSAYILFLDDVTAVNDTQDGIVMCEATSDNAFGFHDFFTTTAGHRCYFAVVPGLTNGCLASSCPGNDAGCSLHLAQTQEQRQTQVASHELAELFSDPEVGSNEGWTASSGPHENGDICNGNSGTLTVGANSWNVQLMYSKWHDQNTNGATTCVVGSPDPLPSLLPACTIVLDRSTFGKDEIDALLTLGSPANVDAAFYVIADGFRPSDLGITAATLSGTPNVTPNVTLTPSVPGMSVTATACVANDPTLGGGIDRFTWVYQVSFTGTGGFPAAVGGVLPVTVSASLTRVSAPVCGANASAVMQLIHEPNPYELDGPVSWLSTDLRVFQINGGASKFNATMGSDPNAFIQQVITNLNSGATGGQTFENDISLDENTSRLELSESVGGTPVFNFAVAKVRYRALSSDATNVRVFFRLFPVSTTSTAYDQSTSYRRGGMSGVTIAKLGIQGGEVSTIPCFALPRVDTATQSMDAQTDTPNVRTIVHNAGGQEVSAYFGCWLDINQPSQLRFPLHPSPLDGPYASGRQSVQSLIRNAHQCLVAEIAFDPDPVSNGATPGSSDKLAQRNLSIVESDNPGSAASHSIPNAFEMRPTTPQKIPGARPDELLIDWSTLPAGSQATFFLPGMAANILRLANESYVAHHLTAADADTLKCPATGLTYLPIPTGTGANIPGLLTVDLPSNVRKGQAFKVVVRQISDAARFVIGSDVTSHAATAGFRWRHVLGSFQVSIPVRTADVLLAAETRLLTTLRAIGQTIPKENRWSRVFQAYVSQVAARVKALGEHGGDHGPLTIVPPSKLLPQATLGKPYSFTFTATGGTPPYRFSIVVEAGLPPGLKLASGGVLSGTPTKGGRFNFSVTVVDSAGTSAQPQVYSIVVG